MTRQPTYFIRTDTHLPSTTLFRLAVGPRFLNGYAAPHRRRRRHGVAVGPRFLNGYAGGEHLQHQRGVAVGPRFLNGYATCSEARSEEHTSEIQSLMRISNAVFCLKKKNNNQ